MCKINGGQSFQQMSGAVQWRVWNHAGLTKLAALLLLVHVRIYILHRASLCGVRGQINEDAVLSLS